MARRVQPAQRGQAMTEFLIAATYVLVPLFVFIPMLAKYVDIKHATIQAARYEAWEYTAWQHRADDHDILDNYESDVTGYTHPFKTPEETRNESSLRFLTAVGNDPYDRSSVALPVAGDRLATWNSATPNPMWRDHRGNSMFDGVIVETLRDTSADTPSLTLFGVNIGDVYDVLLDIVDFAFELLAGILDVIDAIGDYLGDEDASLDPKFSAINTDGYSRVELATRVNVRTDTYALRDSLTAGGAPGTDATLDFPAKAAVLAEGWGAGGTEHTYLQVNGATPSILVKEILDLPVLDEVWDLISFIAPELSECTNDDDPEPPLIRSPFAGPEGNFWPGYVDGDVVHPDRLSVAGEDPSERLGGHVCDESGRCIWDEDVRNLGETNSMEPLSHSPCIP